MKRFKLAIIISLMLSLTGCIQKYELTGQQSDAAAEYMAALLLETDEDYKRELIPIEELQEDNEEAQEDRTEEEDPTPTANPLEGDSAGNGSDDTDTEKVYTISEVIGKDDFDIKYTGYELTASYPKKTEDTYFSIDARQGYQLLVASFTATNKTDRKKTLNLSKEDIMYQLDINVGTIYKPQFTVLENNLQYIDMDFKGGESKTVLLIFEISKDTDLSNINLIISKDDKSEIVEIK